MNESDEHLHQLVLDAQENFGTPEGQRQLLKLWAEIYRSPRFPQRSRLKQKIFIGDPDEIYDDAVHHLMEYLLRNIRRYDSARGTVIAWVSYLLEKRFVPDTIQRVKREQSRTIAQPNLADSEVVIHKRRQQAQYFVEDLGKVATLDMVLIPAGSFLMGSPDDELERREDEAPQHSVTVKTFFLGKYPVTQSQWRAVTAMPQVNLELNPDPSDFKGEDRPVENVSWFEAVEFCDRVSQKTGRPYRLPSEAEWEYACRAGTTTPFHFGETIATDLANYNGTDDPEGIWSGSYGHGSKGIYCKATTSVGSFQVANAFGLSDMHGNVWEWCQDHWHDNYEGAPVDGSAWINSEAEDDTRRLLRGGSWYTYPANCRSARRGRNIPVNRFLTDGFRVVCSA